MVARHGARVWLALGTLYLVWGSTFIALAIVVRDQPPLLAMSVRHLIAGTVLLAFALPRGDRTGDRASTGPSRLTSNPEVVAGDALAGLTVVRRRQIEDELDLSERIEAAGVEEDDRIGIACDRVDDDLPEAAFLRARDDGLGQCLTDTTPAVRRAHDDRLELGVGLA